MAVKHLTTFSCVFFVVGLQNFAYGANNFNKQENYMVNIAEQFQNVHQTEDRLETMESNLQLLKSLTGSFQPVRFIDEVSSHAKTLLTDGLSAASNGSEISESCLSDIETVLQGLMDGQTWALKMIDAMGKPSSNLLGLNIIWLGSYDECVAVRDVVSQNTFNGRYCKVAFPVGPQTTSALSKQGIAVTIGICVPNTCSSQDVQALVLEGIYMLPINTSAVPTPMITCQLESLEFDAKAVATIVVCSILAFLMLLGTAYDILMVQKAFASLPVYTEMPRKKYGLLADEDDERTPILGNVLPSEGPQYSHKKYSGENNVYGEDVKTSSQQPGLLGKILLAFSIYTNGKKLLNTSQPAGSLSAVNGIRFLSMSWVILGHTYAFGITFADNMMDFFPKMVNRFTFQAVLNGTVSVDSFFVLSGLLVAYLALKEMKKKDGAGRFSWGMYYFHRFWRLTPPYMLFLMFYVSLIKYWSNGPLWSQIGVDINECRDSWWRNLLYINNLFDDNKFCMVWSWYLANDMQFFIVSPIFLVPLYYSSVLGGMISLFFLLACWVTTAIISATNGVPANFANAADNAEDVTGQIYFKPYTRIGPYIIGMFTGYILFKTECKVRMPKWLNLLGWAVATGVALSVLYGLYNVNGDNTTYRLSTSVAAFYNAVNRSAWGMALSWVIFACATGNGGFVNTLLSWSPFVPLGRLTYCAYLVHPVVMYVYYMSRSTLIHFYDLQMVYIFLGHLCVSYGVAFCISLAFESPMMGLEKALLGRGKNS